METLIRWYKAANARERARLAELSGVPISNIRFMVGGYRHGARITIETAAKLEAAAEAMQLVNPELPLLPRELLCDACAECPHYLACAKPMKGAARGKRV